MASPRQVIACSATTWKLEPIAAGRVSARSKAWATSSACTWLSTPSPRSGRASGSPVASRRHTSGSRLPAGVITGQPGPLMCPGCRTTDGTPPASVSRCSSSSIAALPMPYSPYAVRGSSSVTGTRAARPCTQIVPQCSSSGRAGRSASTRCWADSGVKQIRSTTASGRRPAIRAPNVPAASSASRSAATRSTERHSGAVVVRLAIAPADRDDLVPGPDQPGHQIGADMTGRSDHHYSTHGSQPTTPEPGPPGCPVRRSAVGSRITYR